MAAHGALSSKIKQLKFMQRAVATDREKTTPPSVSNRVENGQDSSKSSEDWAVRASKTTCIVMTGTNPSIATASRQGILSFGQTAGPIDVGEEREVLMAEEMGGQGGKMAHHTTTPHGVMKRKSPPLIGDPQVSDDILHGQQQANSKKKRKKQKQNQKQKQKQKP